MTTLSSLQDFLRRLWSRFAAEFAAPQTLHSGGTDDGDSLYPEDREREIRVLMAHWF